MAETETVSTIVPDNKNSEVENLRKQLSEAQGKLSEQGNLLQEQAKYVQDADTVAGLIAANPDLQKQLKETYARQYGGGVVATGEKPSKQKEEEPKKKDVVNMENPKIEELDRSIGELKRNQRSEAIRKFEDVAGVSALPDEQKKDVRRKIEEYINTFGQSVTNTPLEALPTVLDKAYKAINVEKMVSDGRMEGMAELYRNQSGGMPYMQGRRLEAEQEETLSSAQLKWADKLGVSADKVKETIKNKDAEDTRMSAAEIKKEKRDRGQE